jgi:zinc transporter ZupT
MAYFIWACTLGAISAVAFPLGAWVGLRRTFSSKWLSIFAAFGAGALLAALSVELVAPATFALTHDALEGTNATEEFLALIVGCVGGGLAYVWLDRTVNNRGGFIRRPSTMIRHGRQAAAREKRVLFETISAIPYFQGLPAENVDELLSELEPGSFKDGETISHQGSAANEVFLILDGSVLVKRNGVEIGELSTGAFTTGLLPLLANSIHLATSVAKGQVKALRISKGAFHKLRTVSPGFDTMCRRVIATRLEAFEHVVVDYSKELLDWTSRTKKSLSEATPIPEFPLEAKAMDEHHGVPPLAVWLGLLLDGIPEALVLGAGMLWGLKPMLEAGQEPRFVSVIPFTLIAGLFLSNFPEALSSSANMLRHGMKRSHIFAMWFSLLVVTSLVAGLGYLVAGQLTPVWTTLFEGLAAGAMLTMIVSAMIPEAVQLGSGNVAGISTLAGFLGAILFKLLE